MKKMDERSWTVLPEHEQDEEKQSGEQGTFLVRILCRQNHSWQGEIVREETNEHVYFRSALELIRLIDSAVPGEDGGPEEPGQEGND